MTAALPLARLTTAGRGPLGRSTTLLRTRTSRRASGQASSDAMRCDGLRQESGRVGEELMEHTCRELSRCDYTRAEVPGRAVEIWERGVSSCVGLCYVGWGWVEFGLS